MPSLHLPDSAEYGFVWWGQSNAGPRGSRAEAFGEMPELALATQGLALTCSGNTTGAAIETLTVTSPLLAPLAWIGAEYRLGTPAAPVAGYGRVLANTDTSITVEWIRNPGTVVASGYTYYRDHRKSVYPGVRILTPYAPETFAEYPAGTPKMPGFAVQSEITTYRQLAAFLPLSFKEGIAGFGIGSAISGGPATAATASDFDFTTAITASILAGGTVVVMHGGGTSRSIITDNTTTKLTGLTWIGPTPSGTPASWVWYAYAPGVVVRSSTGGGAATAATATTMDFTTALTGGAGWLAGGYVRVHHAGGISWSSIGDNGTTGLTGLSWQGDGTPSGTEADWQWEAWVPHYDNNPHELLPGAGFRYPNSEMQPLAPVRNRAIGVTNRAYPDNFGAMVAFAWRMSNLIGRRVNIINLGMPASALMADLAAFGGPATIGWWGNETRNNWHPSTPNNNAARLRELIVDMAVPALRAEGNTKPLKILGIVGFQGEAEAGVPGGRENYEDLLETFYGWVNHVIVEANLSAYIDATTIPTVHAQIASNPWEQDVPLLSYFGDTDGLVNTAIERFAIRRPYTATIDVDASPKNNPDILHFNGVGEARNGKAAAAAMADLVAQALSVQQDDGDAVTLSICNAALSLVGEFGRVTSLDPAVDGTVQASLCRQFLPEARRKLLERHAWAFATRRSQLAQIPNGGTAQWGFAYGIPANAVRVFAVLPPDASDDYSEAFGTDYLSPRQTVSRTTLPYGGVYTEASFTTETDEDGYRVLYSKLESVVARYTVDVADASRYSQAFRRALQWSLAAHLAGSLMKGAEGVKMASYCLQWMEQELAAAQELEGVQRDIHPRQSVDWIRARGG